MVTRSYPLFAVILVTILFTISCADSTSPASPDPIDNAGSYSSSSGGHACWGMYTVTIDKTTHEIDIIPLRGTMFNANVTQFLHPPLSPVNMMEIDLLPTSDFPTGYVDVDVTLNHPFPGLNQYSGFDVIGAFLTSGDKPTEKDFALLIAEYDKDPVLLNPDGHTRWWNYPEFTDPMPLLSFTPGKMGNNFTPSATLNPYKYFADDLEYDMDVADMPTENRGVFTPGGSTHTRNYQIQFPLIDDVPQFIFNYAIDASWDEPDPEYEPDFPVEAFPVSAQSQEAYHLFVNTEDSTLWYEDSAFGGDMEITVGVHDWQGAYNASGVLEEVSAIWIESPVLLDPVDILPTASFTPGVEPTYGEFSATIPSPQLDIMDYGTFDVLVHVESLEPDSYQPQLPGGELFIYPDGSLAAFKFGSVEVTDGQPFVPADDVTGNLTLAVVRNSSETITGLELDWTENTNPSPFYAIYADTNPYDGIDPDTFVIETDTDTVVVDETNWTELSTNGAYVFAVKGRTVSGLSASDSPNFSEGAFVELQDWDGGEEPEPWALGYLNASYKWEEQTGGLIDGSTSIRHNPVCALGQWSGYASPVIPEIDDSAMAFMEFAHISANTGTESYYKNHMGGVTKTGSPPPAPGPNWRDLDCHDVNAVMDGTWNFSNTDGTGWIGLEQFFRGPGDPSEVGWRFYDAPWGTAQITRISFPWLILNAGNTRGAVAWARTNYWHFNVAWLEMDEIAIVVY